MSRFITLTFILISTIGYAAERPIEPPAIGSISLMATVLGFREWKTAEVKKMKSRVSDRQKDLAELTAKEFISAHELTAQRINLEQKLSQSRFNLESVLELSVNDYFVLYLSRFSNKGSAFLSAVKKLNHSELAELMMAYDKHLSNSRNSDDPTAASLMGELGKEANTL